MKNLENNKVLMDKCNLGLSMMSLASYRGSIECDKSMVNISLKTCRLTGIPVFPLVQVL